MSLTELMQALPGIAALISIPVLLAGCWLFALCAAAAFLLPADDDIAAVGA